MKIDMIWLLLFLMCGAGAGIPAAFAQTRAAKTSTQVSGPHKWPIESLKVEGSHNYTAAQILAVAGLKVGQTAGKPDFDAARDRLVATGMFETVGYKFAPGGSGHGYAASFQVVEAQPAYPIRFDDLGVPDKDLTAYLKTKDPLFAPRLAATKGVMDRYKQWIQEYVTAHGSQDKVIAKVTPTGPDEFAILFRPARSDPAVAEVSFEGNEVDPGHPNCEIPLPKSRSACHTKRKPSASAWIPAFVRSTMRADGFAWPSPRSRRKKPRMCKVWP